MPRQLHLEVEKRNAKRVKDALAGRGLLDRSRRIEISKFACHIPTTLRADGEWNGLKATHLVEAVAKETGISGDDIQASYLEEVGHATRSAKSANKQITPVTAAVREWWEDLPAHLQESMTVTLEDLLLEPVKVYALYNSLLVLSKTAFKSNLWVDVMKRVEPAHVQDLYKRITQAFHVAHLAINGAIPRIQDDGGLLRDKGNHLRLPSQFQPLHGDFGPLVSGRPMAADFPPALWTSVKQNGIWQCWAPLYSMFSQGNAAEKQRLRSMLEVDRQNVRPAASTAVDMYAGIGYFSLAYAKAGFQKVVCWELNPWSVEGLRRGATMNGWKVSSMGIDASDSLPPDEEGGKENIVAFEEDNTHAAKRIGALRQQLPPVRHVNCGLLPTSRAVWEDAVRILDPAMGGWIHAHENIANHDREQRTDEMLRIFSDAAAPRRVERWHLQSVKSYSPGVTHCVLDVLISPSSSG